MKRCRGQVALDTRFSTEQLLLRDSALRIVTELGPTTVVDLEDSNRTAALTAAVDDAGFANLRDDAGFGRPLATGTEVGIVLAALGQGPGDASLLGPLLASEVLRRSGVENPGGCTVALTPDLSSLGRAGEDAVCFDAAGASAALVLLDDGSVASTPIGTTSTSTDLTRQVTAIGSGTPSTPLGGTALTVDDVTAVTTFGLAAACNDLVGVMTGAVDLAVGYARDRCQYDTPIGAFQAVQHMLADAKTLLEGSISVALHAGWAVDGMPTAEARDAAAVAKAYCARAAIEVCETVIQVHGGIGNTWECMAHVYLRRAIQSAELFGDDAAQLQYLVASRMDSAFEGVGHAV